MKKYINVALILIICLTPMVFTNDFYQMYILAKAYFFKITMSVALIACCFITKMKYKHYWAYLFVIPLLLATVLSVNPTIAFWGQYEKGLGFTGWTLLVFMTVMIVERFSIKDIELLEQMLLIVGVSYFFRSIITIDRMENILPTDNAKYRLNSFASNPNMTGNVYVLLLPLAMKFHPILAIAFFFGMYLAKAKGAMIAGAIAGYFWYVKNKWMRLGFILTSLGALLFLRLAPSNYGMWKKVITYEKSQRLLAMRDALPFLKNPLGTGDGVFRQQFSPMISEQLENRADGVLYDHIHNVYADHFIQLGWIPGAIILWLLYVCFTCERREIRYFAIGYCIVGWGTFDTWDTLPIVFALFGVALLCKIKKEIL